MKKILKYLLKKIELVKWATKYYLIHIKYEYVKWKLKRLLKYTEKEDRERIEKIMNEEKEDKDKYFDVN